MYLSQTEKCIGLKLRNIIVSSCKKYLSKIVKCICLKLQNVCVSNRVAKCHGFDGLIRVKMSACWGKKVAITCNFSKSSLFGKMYTTYASFSMSDFEGMGVGAPKSTIGKKDCAIQVIFLEKYNLKSILFYCLCKWEYLEVKSWINIREWGGRGLKWGERALKSGILWNIQGHRRQKFPWNGSNDF